MILFVIDFCFGYPFAVKWTDSLSVQNFCLSLQSQVKSITMNKKLLLLPLLALFAFVSCSDDDEETVSFTKSTIVGTWEVTEVSNHNWQWMDEGTTLTFNSDGTCETMTDDEVYVISEGVVATYYADTHEPLYTYTLLSTDGDVYKVKMGGTLDESNISTNITMEKK